MARIKLDLDRTVGEVDRRIFGGFIEHLGRCIYGGVFEPGSPLADERGFRRDVIEAVRPLGVPVLRWPGGNFVSGYHWTDGIGPPEARPRRMELAWHAEESNRFGTDEFLAYCRELGAEPYICLNMGTGTMDEAQAWVEYCNGTGDTYWANRRRENGHPEPYRVRYWGLGNELYGHWQIGALSPEAYVTKAREWAKVLRWTDPEIQLVSCGENGWSEWDRVVVDGLVAHVDFHSVHIYTGSEDYWSDVLAPHQAERALRSCQALIDRARYLQRVDHPVHVAYDEWNVWFRQRAEQAHENGLEERYTLADALAVATYLNVFVRQCRTVRMANLAQLVNVIAPVVTRPDGLFLQAIYHPLRLYAEHTRSLALDALVDCEEVTHVDPPAPDPWPHRVADLGPFKLLDVAATRDPDARRLVLAVVNRSPDSAVRTTVSLGGAVASGQVTTWRVDGADPRASNDFDHPDEVTVTTRRRTAKADQLEEDFPPHSLTLLDVELG
jgi:alpha-L-arabinofuranosidase